MAHEFKCSNQDCGYKGQAKGITLLNIVVGIVLCVPMIFPGILYFYNKFFGGSRYLCPKCGMQLVENILFSMHSRRLS